MRCPSCRADNAVDARFCAQCATPLVAAPAVQGERRQLTVLFCDLVGSTALAERLDPEDLSELLRRYHAACEAALEQAGGHVAQYLGDGLLVYFGYPTAHEDSAQRAIEGGLCVLDEIRALNPSLQAQWGARLQVRIGIHSGTAVVGAVGGREPRERLAVGDTPNLAAKVQEAARPDTVFVSEATRRLTEGYFAFEPAGELVAHEGSQPLALYRIAGASGAKSRLDAAAASGFSPFVGRDEELHLLLDRWADAKAGRGPIVLLDGEPGIGKSRHVRVLRERLQNERHAVIECRSSPHHTATTLYPIIELIGRQLGFAPETAPAERLRRLEEWVARTRQPGDSAVPLLASLLSIPPDARHPAPDLPPARQRQATFDLLLALVRELAAALPVLFVIEDLQWADPSTIEWLGLIVDGDPIPGLLTLATHRPEFRASWNKPGRVSQLSLARLGKAQMEAIIRRVAGERSLPPGVLEQVMAKADGVPLFVEEITKAVLESGSSLVIPATVQDSLMARLDRLGDVGKSVAQLAATIGREVPGDLLRATARMDEAALARELARLVDAGLLFRRKGAQEVYVFKHALIQDAAYESLLRSTRQQYHRQIARTLGDRFPQIAETEPELLAQHRTRAGDTIEAIGLWMAAGQRAVTRSAYGEAISHFRRALEQLLSLPASIERDQREIEIRAGLGLALISTRGFAAQEVEETYKRARELCEQFGDLPAQILYGVWAVHLVRGDRDATQGLAALFRRLLERSTEPLVLLMAHAALGVRTFFRAEYAESEAHFLAARTICEAGDPREQMHLLLKAHGFEGYLYPYLYLVWIPALRGEVQRANEAWQAALEMAERTKHPYGLAMTMSFGAAVAHDLLKIDLARELGERQLALSTENGFLFWLATANCTLGWVQAMTGDPAGAIPRLQQGLALQRGMGAYVTLPYYQAYLAEAQLAAGDADAALATIDDALAFSAGKLATSYVPELERLRGEVLARLGRLDDAETCVRKALAGTRACGARLYELRTAVTLGRILRQRGRDAEGRGLVTDLLGWFGEANPSSDVAAARAFLAA